MKERKLYIIRRVKDNKWFTGMITYMDTDNNSQWDEKKSPNVYWKDMSSYITGKNYQNTIIDYICFESKAEYLAVHE